MNLGRCPWLEWVGPVGLSDAVVEMAGEMGESDVAAAMVAPVGRPDAVNGAMPWVRRRSHFDDAAEISAPLNRR